VTGHRLHFLGWDKPLLHAAVDTLMDSLSQGWLDLSALLVIVPTRHSGRRLREALAMRAAARNTGVLAPRVETPESFLALISPAGPGVDRVTSLAVWASLLGRSDYRRYPNLFFSPLTGRDYSWALSTADRLSRLRRTLGENGFTLGALAGGDHAPHERERWQDLARLEQDYLARMDELGLTDRDVALMRGALAPSLPAGTARIAVMGVPDPIPLTLDALAVLARSVPVDLYVHAPASLSDGFDEWGRAEPAWWSRHHLKVADEAILVASGPGDQAHEVVGHLRRLSVSAEDLAVGVADPQVVPFLQRAMSDNAIPAHSPAGEPLARHPVVHLVECLADLAADGRFASLEALVRHPDYLHLLLADHPGADAVQLLGELDRFAREHLPESLTGVRHALRVWGQDYPLVGHLVRQVDRDLGLLEERGLVDGLLDFLGEVYESPVCADRRFHAAAGQLARLLLHLEEPGLTRLDLGRQELRQLLRRLLAGASLYGERPTGAVDLLGWLELSWEDAPHLVVAGMNDGIIPEVVSGEAFLPDAVRQELGLRTTDSRIARDAFLTAALLAPRVAAAQAGGVPSPGGSLTFVVGRRSDRGEPLKPSRLLFRCADEVLPGRTRKLFSEVPETRVRAAGGSRWRLRPVPPPRPLRTMSVTAFRDYLACPFRFYLRRVLGAVPLDERPGEMDAAQIGDLCHHALETLGRDEAVRREEDPRVVTAFLQEHAARWVHHCFGANLSLPLRIQLEAAQQRLAAAARVHVEQLRAGWRIVAAEHRLGGGEGILLEGFRVRGIVDRIDRHRDGRVCVLDYKTADIPSPPAKAHLVPSRGGQTPEVQVVERRGRTYRFKDLQLLLYRKLLEPEFGPDIVCGYFNLPKAVSQTAVHMWEDLDEVLVDRGYECACSVLEGVRSGVFWPPADRVPFDDYAALFPAGVRAALAPDWTPDALRDPEEQP